MLEREKERLIVKLTIDEKYGNFFKNLVANSRDFFTNNENRQRARGK